VKDLKSYHQRPPIFTLSGTATPLKGDHLNLVWQGMAHRTGPIEEPGMPVVAKYFGQAPGKIAIELACGLAGVALDLPIPQPALVIADREFLPDVPAGASDQVLLFGSWFEPSQQLLRRPQNEKFVWNKVCESKAGAPGAIWDELVANDDRHYKNFLFDGAKWWLIDHDKALPPLAQLERQVAALIGAGSQTLVEFRASVNQLAMKMLFHRPENHGMQTEAAAILRLKAQVDTMCLYVRAWTHENDQLNELLKHTSVVLDAIKLRLPAVSLLISRRLSHPEYGTLSWTSSQSLN
jgi:hypothetical protein